MTTKLNKLLLSLAIFTLSVITNKASAQIKPPTISGPDMNTASEAPKAPVNTSTNAKPVYRGAPDVLAEYPGGKSEFLKYLRENFDCDRARVPKEKLQRAVVEFEITETGKGQNFRLKESISQECDAAFIKLLEDMPLWKPATKDGIAVPMHFMIPVTITSK